MEEKKKANGNEYELVNKTRHKVTIFNNSDEKVKELPAANEPCEVVYESEKVNELNVENEGIDMMVRDGKRTKNLPSNQQPGDEVETLYIVSFVVREANPKRIDFISPTNYVRNDDSEVVGCRSFNTHPELERDPDERRKYPKWVECPNCGGYSATRRWKGNFKKSKDRMMVQLNEHSETGVRNYLTVQMPSISKEVDLFLRGDELKVLETDIGVEEDLESEIVEG